MFLEPPLVDVGTIGVSRTASDAISGISVDVALRDLATRSWVDDEGRRATRLVRFPATPDSADAPTTSYSRAFNDLGPSRYRIYVQAFDRADNRSVYGPLAPS